MVLAEALDLEVTLLVAGLVAALALVAYIVYYVISAGLFYKPVIVTGSPPFETVCIGYKFYQGTYSVDAKRAFCDLAKVSSKQPLNFLGIYYDNPKLVSHCCPSTVKTLTLRPYRSESCLATVLSVCVFVSVPLP